MASSERPTYESNCCWPEDELKKYIADTLSVRLSTAERIKAFIELSIWLTNWEGDLYKLQKTSK